MDQDYSQAELALKEAEERLAALRRDRLEAQASGGLSGGLFSSLVGLSSIPEPEEDAQDAEQEPAPVENNGATGDRAEILRRLDEEKAELDRKFQEMMGSLEDQDRKIMEECKSREEVLEEEEKACTALALSSATKATPLNGSVRSALGTGMTRLVAATPGIPVLSDAAAGIWQGVKDFHFRRARLGAQAVTRYEFDPASRIHAGPTYVMSSKPGVNFNHAPYPMYANPGLPPEIYRQIEASSMQNGRQPRMAKVLNGDSSGMYSAARSVGSAVTLAVPGTSNVVRRTVGAPGPPRNSAQTPARVRSGVASASALGSAVQTPTTSLLPVPTAQAAPPQVTIVQPAATPTTRSSESYLFPGWIFGD